MFVTSTSSKAMWLVLAAARGDRSDPAVDQRPDARPPVAVDGHRVEQLVAGRSVQELAASGADRVEGRFVDLARPGQVPDPQPPGVGLGGVEAAAVGGQADAVGRVERCDDLPARRAVGCRVVDAGAVGVAIGAGAVVGEPEAPGAVEHQVVGAAQLDGAPVGGGRGGVDRLDLARVEVDPLDRPALVGVGARAGHGEAP